METINNGINDKSEKYINHEHEYKHEYEYEHENKNKIGTTIEIDFNKLIYELKCQKKQKKINHQEYLDGYLSIFELFAKHHKQPKHRINFEKEKRINVFKPIEPYEKINPLFVKNLDNYFITYKSPFKKKYIFGAIYNCYTGEIVALITLGTKKNEFYHEIFVICGKNDLHDVEKFCPSTEIFNEFTFVKKNQYNYYCSYFRDIFLTVLHHIFDARMYFKNIIIIGEKCGGDIGQLLATDLEENFFFFARFFVELDFYKKFKISCYLKNSRPVGNLTFFKMLLTKKTLVQNNLQLLYTLIVHNEKGDANKWNEIQNLTKKILFI